MNDEDGKAGDVGDKVQVEPKDDNAEARAAVEMEVTDDEEVNEDDKLENNGEGVVML